MTGLSSIGLYLPRQCAPGAGGEHRSAHSDEDALTMAVEAAHRCLEEVEPLTFGGLFFASVTSPYRATQLASAIATACDLPRDIVTADFTGSARAGLAALSAGVRAVEGGVRKVLVVAADRECDACSDGAVAVVVDSKARLCRFQAAAAVAEDLTFQGAPTDDDGRRTLRDLAEVIERVINEHGVGADQLAALAVGGADDDVLARLADLVGVDATRHLIRSHVTAVAALGTPQPLFELAAALERAAAGDRIVVAANAEGAEALLFEAADGAGPNACRPGLLELMKRGSASGEPLAALEGPRVWDDGSVPEPSVTIDLRALQQATRFYGTRCAACGGVEFPETTTCRSCGTREGLEPAKLAKQGRVVAQDVESAHASVELEDGAQVDLEVTDGAPSGLSAGAAVRLTFRRAGPNLPPRYAWKTRLV